jgi:hypothetical protein
MTKLLTGEQVAAILGIRPQSLRIRRMRGAGPPFIRLQDAPTARVFYPEAELHAWLDARPRYTGTGEEKAALGASAAGTASRHAAPAQEPRGDEVTKNETTAPGCSPNAARDLEKPREESTEKPPCNTTRRGSL